METSSDAEIQAAVSAFTAGREAGEIVDFFYSRSNPGERALNALAALLPIEQVEIVKLVDRLNLSALSSFVILMAALRKLRGDDAWIHYAVCKSLNRMILVGIEEAKQPGIIHSLLAVEGLKNVQPTALSLPLTILARDLATFSPRQAIRSGMRAARHGATQGLREVAPAMSLLGLEGDDSGPPITQVMNLAKALKLSADNIPRTTSVRNAAGVRSAMIEQPSLYTFPPVLGDSSHYLYAMMGQQVEVPGVTVHTFEGGFFSIDARARGNEQHYVFDRNKDCVLEFANGTDPFITEEVLECDGPVAILDDHFSGAMNVCHFLLDRVTRIPPYERAWSAQGKFFLVDDFPYYRDIFARMGLTDRIIIPSSKRISIHAPEILFSSNIAADFRHPAQLCAPWAIDYLRRALKIEDRPADPRRRLLISRADTKGRRIQNWEQALPMFRRHGFEVVELSGLATESQIDLFRDASRVIGVHGAGLTNILFAPRDCSVLEILPPMVATRAYWLLSSRVGQRYSALIADDPELARPDYKTWVHNPIFNDRDIVLPMDRLEAALIALDATDVVSEAFRQR